MLRGEDHWLEISDLLDEAALGGGWDRALNGMADACGGAHGQLIGVSPEPALRFNWSPRLDPRAAQDLAALAADASCVAPRIGVGLRAPVLQAWHDDPGGVAATYAPSYAAFCRRYDIPYASQTNLLRDASGVISLAVLRTEAQGAPDADDRQAFEALAPRARSAVKLQKALEGRGAELLSGALEGLGRAAFICDGLGLVRARTAQAEPLLDAGVLRLRDGRLSAADVNVKRRLEAAIACARQDDAARPAKASTLLLGIGTPDAITVIDVIALPRAPYAFGFEPRVLVVARGEARQGYEIELLLRAAYGLTPTEAHIAAQLGAGESPDAIADARQVAPGTVRTQVRAIYQKMDVNRQVEFSARLARFR